MCWRGTSDCPRSRPMTPPRRWSWSRRSCSARRSLVTEHELLVVELLLHASHDRVADRSFIACPEQLPPLHREKLPREPQVGSRLRLNPAVENAVRMAAQMPRAIAIAIARARE